MKTLTNDCKTGYVLIVLLVLGIVVCPANAGLWVDPNSFDVNTVEGTILEETLTISNDGDSELNFTLRTREISREVLTEPVAQRSLVGTIEVTENKMVLEYEFGEPIVSKTKECDLVQIKGLKLYERVGAPIVPVRPVTVLIPFGKKVVASKVIASDTRQLPGTYRLPPAQRPYPLSYKSAIEQTDPDPAIYSQALPWPGIGFEEVGTQSKRGYRLFTVNLFPVQYIPATGEISYATGLQLEIDLVDVADSDVLRPSEAIKAKLAATVDNPHVLRTYPHKGAVIQELEGATLLPSGLYQYVIITSEALEASPGPWNFQALRDAKVARGMTATIVTTEWIYANYDGTRPDGSSDNQTRIRNFLIDSYQTWGTEYVLLGGTNGIVPARKLWVEAWPGGDTTTMPVDMYYGCVEPSACTFDYDADGKYGEPTDGVGGGDVDLYAEIYVGRAAVENSTELSNFIKKTLTYDMTANEYLPRIAMLGEYLGFGGVSEYAKDSMEQIRLGGEYDGYFTYGFENHLQPDYYDFNTVGCLPENPSWCWPLYDKDYDWPKSDLIDLMNGGIHVFNHLGHADYTYCMKLNTSNLASLTNTDYFFAYSQGCMPGGFDTANCFAEVITTMEHGAFAVIMNARYGWGRGNSTDGPSQRFARQFWDATLAEDMLEMGRANQDSKEDNLWDINGDCIRWCYYELNLFGDPEQQFRFEEACEWLTLEPEEGTVEPGDSNDVSVTFDALEMVPGIYEAEIIIISNDPCSPTTIPVTMTVNPDDLEVTPIEDFESSGTRGGPFTPACITYTLTNNGSAAVGWTTNETENWVEVEPNEGVLEPNDSINVNVCITSDADLLDPNIYDQILIFENTDSNSIKLRFVTLTVKPPDCFTESFDAGDNDLSFLSLTFSPDGSTAYYEACREEVNEFPTDHNGGINVSLGDDDFAEVVLSNDANILFYGTRYDRFYIGSNGYITFGQGDTKFSGTLQNHFNMPRISPLFADLSPSDNISYKKLNDRVVVTFQDVWLFGDKTAKNSFQVEMFYVDGTIRITWLDIAPAACVTGLSEGYGLPPFFLESDLSTYVPCWPYGDFNRDYSVDIFDLAIFVSHWLEEDCCIPYWCGKTDLNFSRMVETADFAIFAGNWLTVEDWWLRPISHWKFDEGEGDIAYDSVGNNHGTINGATWTTGQINSALEFDGVDDYVNLGNDNSLKPPLPITISAWIRLNSLEITHKIVSLDDHSYTYCGVWLHVSKTTDRLGVGFGDGKGWGSQQYRRSKVGTTLLTTNVWYHVVGVIRNATDMDLYVNGQNDGGEYSGSGGDLAYLTGNSRIGAGNDGEPDNFMDGKIDDVRVYDRALTAEEIWQLYWDGLGEKARNPNPADGEAGIDPNVVLSWSPGKDAASHDVYFGTDYNDVNDADTSSPEYMGNFDVNSWDPNGLEYETIYYWRIDEVNGPSVWKGDVWSFTTQPLPIIITNVYELQAMQNDLDAWYKLGNDIDASDTQNWNEGAGFEPIGDSINPFTGSFDGQGYVITRLYINRPTTDGVGLFGDIRDGAEIKNVGLSDVDVTARRNSGSLVGHSNGATVRNSWSAGTVQGSYDGQMRLGGLIGISSGANTFVSQCYSNATVIASGGAQQVGGLAGYNGHGSVMSDCYATGDVTGSSKVGGLVGDNLVGSEGTLIERCYSSGRVTGSGGGLVGYNWQGGVTQDSYWDIQTSGKSSSCGGTGKTTAEMMQQSTFVGWDFVNIWDIIENETYPFLRGFDTNLGLVGWWKFDEGSGDTAYDSAGSVDGTIHGAQWVDGVMGNALQFDGNNDYVSLPTTVINGTEFTVAAWANHLGTGGGTFNEKPIFQQKDAGISSFVALFAERKTTSNVAAIIRSHTGGENEQILYYPMPEHNEWHHYVMTVDANDFILYMDGQEVASTTNNQTGNYTNSIDYIQIARSSYLSTHQGYFNGIVDDVRIYDRALSNGEIWQLYQDGLNSQNQYFRD